IAALSQPVGYGRYRERAGIQPMRHLLPIEGSGHGGTRPGANGVGCRDALARRILARIHVDGGGAPVGYGTRGGGIARVFAGHLFREARGDLPSVLERGSLRDAREYVKAAGTGGLAEHPIQPFDGEYVAKE